MENNSLMKAFHLAFLYVDIYTFNKDWKFREEKVPYSMIRFIVEGNAKFIIDDNVYDVSKNTYLKAAIFSACQLQTIFPL